MNALVTDVNGGNANAAHHDSNLEDIEKSELQMNSEESPEILDKRDKMYEDGVNGDDKCIVKQTEIIKRKMRKSKSNSTSSVENDAKPRLKGSKRKLSEPDALNSDECGEFMGFSPSSIMIIETGVQILQKLISEAELEESGNAKRKRAPSIKGSPPDLETKTLAERLESPKGPDAEEKEAVIPKESKLKKNGKDPEANAVNATANMADADYDGSMTAQSIENEEKNDSPDAMYREPFKYGWKREMIYKGGLDSNLKRSADIYYYSPKGKRVKNLREVAECLTTKDLVLDNFTFSKEPIGMNDPALEIIRDAKRLRSDSTGTPTSTPAKRTLSKRSLVKNSVTPPPAPKPEVKTSPYKATPKLKVQVKVPGKRGSAKKEVRPAKEPEMLPPQWNSLNVTRRSQGPAEKVTSPKSKRMLKKKPVPVEVPEKQHFMVSVCAGYDALSRIFQYLKVQELLRAARVCRMWRDLAAHPALWKTVRMKNSQVTDWDGLAAALKRHGTEHLDLRKMLVASESDSIWEKFVAVIPNVPSLIKLELCRCPASVVEDILKCCPQLEVLSAMSIKCDSLNVESLGNLKHLTELRLKSISGMSIQDDLSPLAELTQLTHLSLTSVKELGKKKIDVINNLVKLETLELGECSDFPEKFGTEVLLKLTNLERLRLEKGQGSCCTFDILDGISKLEKLHQLELVNFDVKNGFDKYLANCKNIKRLLIIPTYISQSATSNNMVLGGVTELSDNLTHFVWGVTLELLRVTELFVDQCNQMNKPVSGDSIPVLKPVPCLRLIEPIDEVNNSVPDEKQSNLTNPQVDILPLPQLQKLLLTALPKTRVKILKIPFHATWRQSISDTTSQ